LLKVDVQRPTLVRISLRNWGSVPCQPTSCGSHLVAPCHPEFILKCLGQPTSFRLPTSLLASTKQHLVPQLCWYLPSPTLASASRCCGISNRRAIATVPTSVCHIAGSPSRRNELAFRCQQIIPTVRSPRVAHRTPLLRYARFSINRATLHRRRLCKLDLLRDKHHYEEL
jgi:hypothetical protein